MILQDLETGACFQERLEKLILPESKLRNREKESENSCLMAIQIIKKHCHGENQISKDRFLISNLELVETEIALRNSTNKSCHQTKAV